MDFTRHRGTHRLEVSDVQQRVFQLLRVEPVNEHLSDRELRVAMAELLNRGVGLDAPQGPGEGYRQILSLYGGTLLKLAGAKVEAIDHEVQSRDEARLESLVRAVLARLAQASEAGEPGSGGAAASSHTGSAVAEAKAVPVASFANVASPFYKRNANGARQASSGTDSPAFAYLRERLTDDVLRFVRTLPEDVAPPEAVDAPHAQDPRRAMALQMADSSDTVIELVDGVQLRVAPGAAPALKSASSRAALIRALASALQREWGEAE